MDHYSLQVLPINKHYQDTIDQAVMEFEKYFEVKLKHKICLIFLNSRQEFDDIVGRKTQPFETAFSIYNLTFLMSEKVYNQESNKKFDLQKNLSNEPGHGHKTEYIFRARQFQTKNNLEKCFAF